MRRPNLASSAALAALLASAGHPCSANATVIIKTFQFAICVAGAKHPDGCKNVAVDAHVVVSDDAMQGLDAKIGQGATIVAVPETGAASPSSDQARRHRHENPQ